MLKKNIILSIIFMIIICLIQIPTYAAGSFSASAGKTTLTVGEKTTFVANANGCGGNFKISSSDSSVVSIEGSSSEWIENGSHSVTLVANKAGKATITLTAVDVADSTTADEITGSKSVTITVNAPAPEPPANNGGDNGGSSKSGDATLKSLKIAGKTYNNPGTDFTITVNSNVTTVDISAVPNHGGAHVSGTGSKELVTGSNTVTITVTAENGAKKNYSIRIRKLADDTVTPNVPDTSSTGENNNGDTNGEPDAQNQDTPQFLRLSYLLIDDAELMPEFDSETFEYTLNVSNKDSLNIIAQANMEGAEVEIIRSKRITRRRK